MEQQIQYCTSADGTRIAYSVMGQGPPLLFVLGWANHLELQVTHPEAQKFFFRLSRERLLIQFDCRGVGLSQREVHDLSLETYLADVNAVASRLDLQRFDLWGVNVGAPVAAAYAASYPERVSKLVLWGACSRGKEIVGPDAMQGLLGLMQTNWSLARRALADLVFPSGPTEQRNWFSDLLRQTISPETLGKYLELQVSLDVTPYLSLIEAPALLVHRRADIGVPIAAGKATAALIPDARFIALDGDIGHPCLGDISYIQQVQQFLEGRMETAVPLSGVSPAAEDKEADPMIGRTISHYKVLEKLGEGGMGVVYKAEDRKLRRTVALKFLPQEMTRSQEWEERFLREAQAAAALDHPSICTVYEVDEAEGRAFIAMAYVEGQSLEERIRSGQLDTNEALDIAIQVAEGLREAHEQGVVHRDIKSANIMVGRRGQTRIMDFGLAKLTEQSRLTKTATIMGTVSYMSPEQARGETAIDHRTDIWSLGVVLYEMLAGTLPFDAPSDAALLHKIIYEPEQPIRDHKPDLSVSLEQAVKKAMQKDPSERYEDMEALISDLKSIRAGGVPVIDLEEKTIPSIAVLPFADMSPAKDQDYFCDGISESIINELTQLSDLRVIARTSAFSFKGQNLDVREIGKKLNVGTVLEGSIQKAGDRVRVTAQLVNTARGEHLWSEKYDRDMKDVFAIQDEITEAIVAKLTPKLLGAEKAQLAKRQTVDIEVYNLYLRGRWFWNKRTPDGLKKSIECFEQAIEKDPNYALAHVGLADSHIVLPTWVPTPGFEEYSKAKQFALKAIEIDDGLAEAHTSLAFVKMTLDYDWTGSESEHRRALNLNPGYAQAHLWYALLLTAIHRHEEALGRANTALQLDPLSLTVYIYAGFVFNFAGAYDRTIELIKKAIEMDPGFGMIHMVLGDAYYRKSMYKEALAEYEKEAEHTGTLGRFSSVGLGRAYARMGMKDKVKQLLENVLQEAGKRYIWPYGVAQLYFSLGDNDAGFQWLEKAYEERDVTLSFWFRTEPNLDNIRSDPRYGALLDKMNLPRPTATVPMIEPSPSIAVLPFVNMSADPEQEYFCDGLAEELINALTQIRDLKVIARTSAFSFKGKDVKVTGIGKELKVDSVLEGSVRKAGNRLRITAQLVETANGHHLWSERYDRELDDVFAIQDEMTLAIVDKVRPRLLSEEQTRRAERQTVDFEPYNLYLKGRYFWNKQSGEGLQSAINYFKQAMEKAPDYAPPYAGLADTYIVLPFYAAFAPRQVFPMAKEAALKALEINEELAETHVALANIKAYYEWDWEGSERELKRAIELNPSYAHARKIYAAVLEYQTRFDEAFEEIRVALELDPLSISTHLFMVELLLSARRYDEAIEASVKVIEMDPNWPLSHFYLGSVYFMKEMYGEAMAEYEREMDISESPHVMAEAFAACTYALMGREEKARQALNNLIERSEQEYIPSSFPARICFALGEHHDAFAWLDQAYEERDSFLCYLKADPFIDIVRSDPRYRALLKKIGLDT